MTAGVASVSPVLCVHVWCGLVTMLHVLRCGDVVSVVTPRQAAARPGTQSCADQHTKYEDMGRLEARIRKCCVRYACMMSGGMLWVCVRCFF